MPATDASGEGGGAERPLVAHTPGFTKNPYLQLLTDAIGRRGWETQTTLEFPTVGGPRPPAIVHLHWERRWTVQRRHLRAVQRSGVLLARILAAKRSGAGIVWTLHNLRDHDAPWPAFEHGAQLAIARLADRIVVHHAAGVDEARTWLRGTRTPFVVMPHGAYPIASGIDEASEPAADQARARRDLGLPSDELVLAAIGLVRPYKRLDVVIDAVRRSTTPVTLVVAGSASDDQADLLRRAAGDDRRIRLLLDYHDDATLARVMVAADAAVLASATQFTSGSAVFALSHGRAVIGVDGSHLRSLCGEAGAVYLRRGSADELTDAIERHGRAELAVIGDHNRQRAAELSWDRCVEPLVEAYDALRGDRAPRRAGR